MSKDYDEELAAAVEHNSVHPLAWKWEMQAAEKLEELGVEDIYDALLKFGLVDKLSRWEMNKKYLTITCPFHQDKTPSCVFWKSINGFKCYGCGESGDLIMFIKKMEALKGVKT